MDTSVDRARGGPAGAKARQGLTDAKLRDLPPRERAYKVSDGGNGLHVVVSPSGSRSFRYDYRLSGRGETLTIGRHEPVARHAQRSHLAYGMDLTLEEARLLLARARVDVSSGRSPARAKVEQRSEVADAMSFGRWATRYFEFKSDSKSGAERLADSTLSLRRSIYNRILAGPFGKLNLDEIKPVALGELLDRVKTERGPGPAVHARELVLQVYRFAAGKGIEVDNPAEALARKAYATFVPRERNLSRHEIKALLEGLEQTGTAPTLRLAVRFADQFIERSPPGWPPLQHRIIALKKMFRGTVTQTSVYPREVVKEALAVNAAAVVLAHNHPSGSVEPSRADEYLTQTLKTALALVDVRVLDHLVVAGAEVCSFAERGLL